ncbi:uncharacterized protein UDID_17089 [Ustilago sp. UG-2017a]|nr:uncharacterized protein UDID_17089 [Ustilago sp. UG-2017a]
MLSKHLLHLMLHRLDHRVDMFERDLGAPHFLCSSRKLIPAPHPVRSAKLSKVSPMVGQANISRDWVKRWFSAVFWV